ncbi:MAG: phosphoadenylyl-sulfate reductase [SAR324 cluster bacterium]|nr:phosphoadenylyl-sulfate reductase [SAR324 cluster bacterium]
MANLVTLSEQDLQPVNQYLESRTPYEILEWSIKVFPRIGILTSGQKAGSILCKLVYKSGHKLDLVFSDTGVLFQETYDTMEQIRNSYGLPLKRYAPKLSMEEQTRLHGVLYISHAGQEKCCHMRKVEPLLELHQDYDALLGPLRRGEGGARSKVPIVSMDTSMKLIRINPMATISNEDYETLALEQDTIINPLHEQGFPTIGCNRCTTPVRPDERPRAGRWRHLSGVDYCGINPTDVSHQSQTISIEEAIVLRLRQTVLSAI